MLNIEFIWGVFLKGNKPKLFRDMFINVIRLSLMDLNRDLIPLIRKTITEA
jgi:hypothetical protein